MAEPTLMDKVNSLIPQAPQPTTVQGANLIGGTPKQQDMAGTQAAKAKVAKEATLAGADRLQSSVAAGVAPEVQKAEALTKLGGSAAQRVAAAISKAVNTPQQTDSNIVQANSTAVGTAMGLTPQQVEAQKADPKSQYNQASQAVKVYASHPGDETTRAKALSSLQGLGIDPQTAVSLIDTSAQALGATIAKSPIMVGSLDLKNMAPGVNDLNSFAAALGMKPEALAKVSVSDLPSVIESVRLSKAAEVDNVRAEMESLPEGSQQRAILAKKLANLGGAGVITAQNKVVNSIHDIDMANKIEGLTDAQGNTYTAEKLLGDGDMSDLIVRWMQAPAAERARLVPPDKFSGLNNWLTSHEKALADLTQTAQQGVTQYQNAQQSQASLGTGALSAQTMAALGITKTTGLTQAEAAASKAKLDSSAIGQLMAAGKTSTVSALQALPPDQLSLFLKKTPADIEAAQAAAASLKADPDLAKLVGAGDTGAFVTDPTILAKINQYKPAVDAIKAAGHSAWLEDTNYAKLDPATMSVLNKNPERYDQFTQFNADKAKVAQIAAVNPADKTKWPSLLQSVFGVPVDIAVLNKNYSDALKLASMGDKGAKAVLDQMYLLGYSPANPQFSKVQAAKLQADMSKKLGTVSQANIIAGKVDSLPNLNPAATSKIMQDAINLPVRATAGTPQSKYESQLADNKIDAKEMQAEIQQGQGRSEDMLKLIKSLPEPAKSSTQKIYDQTVSQYASKAVNDLVATTMDNYGQKDFNSWINSLGSVTKTNSSKALGDIESLVATLTKNARLFPAQASNSNNLIIKINAAKKALQNRIAATDAKAIQARKDEQANAAQLGADINKSLLSNR